jgi:hypothetical protein
MRTIGHPCGFENGTESLTKVRSGSCQMTVGDGGQGKHGALPQPMARAHRWPGRGNSAAQTEGGSSTNRKRRVGQGDTVDDPTRSGMGSGCLHPRRSHSGMQSCMPECIFASSLGRFFLRMSSAFRHVAMAFRKGSSKFHSGMQRPSGKDRAPFWMGPYSVRIPLAHPRVEWGWESEQPKSGVRGCRSTGSSR